MRDELKAVVELGLESCRTVADRIEPRERDRAGTYEKWSSKDGLAHIAEWLDRDLSRLAMASDPLPSVTEDELADVNRAIFDKHSGKSFDEVLQFVEETFAKARELCDSMSDEDLRRQRHFSDGTDRPAWRMVAGHALMHAVPHLTLICRRVGIEGLSENMETRTAAALLKLDDNPTFVGTVQYNLACHYALSGAEDKALELLKDAFAKEPPLKEFARSDSDLDGLRGSTAFKELLGP